MAPAGMEQAAEARAGQRRHRGVRVGFLVLRLVIGLVRVAAVRDAEELGDLQRRPLDRVHPARPLLERRRGQLVYTELQSLLSNASLPIVRAAWVPVCFKLDDACCAAAPSDSILMHSVWPWTQTTEQTLALRAHVAAALSLPTAARPSVVYVSSQHAISGRHIER